GAAAAGRERVGGPEGGLHAPGRRLDHRVGGARDLPREARRPVRGLPRQPPDQPPVAAEGVQLVELVGGEQPLVHPQPGAHRDHAHGPRPARGGASPASRSASASEIGSPAASSTKSK
ncbi:MAG: hypothetical protein ACK559_03655, partial [bacterium]